MRLSDVKGDRTLDVIADLIEPISSIAMDKEAAGLFKPKKDPRGKDPKRYFAERMRKGAPKLLKGHKDDVISILSTIKGVTPEEYSRELNLAVLLRDLVELMTDDLFADFLSSAGTSTLGGASGDASESTGDQKG